MPRIIEVFGDMARVNPVPVGSSINDFMLASNPELKNFPMPVVAGHVKQGVSLPCTENDVELIFRRDWGQSLAENETVVLVAILRPLGGGGGGGSGGGILQAVLGVVMIAASAFMWWNPIGWAAFAGLSASFLGGMALTGGVLLLGGITGMLGAQPKSPSMSLESNNEASSPTYSLNASSNQARLLQPVPEGFGKIQITPDIVANPYTTYEGNDQYLYAVYGIGRGEYVVHEMLFGDDIFWRDGEIIVGSSLVAEDGDIEVEIVAPGNEVTLFPDNVESNPNVSQIQLFHQGHEDYRGWMGPYSSPPAGTQASKFQFDFLFPRGVGWWSNDGALWDSHVDIAIQARLIDDNGLPLGDWIELDPFQTGQMNTTTPQRFSHFVELPLGRYEFQVQNLNTQGNGGTETRFLDDAYIDGLRAYLPGTLRYNQSCIALKVRATNNLTNSASQQFHVLYTRKLPIWDPTTRKWSAPQETRRFDAAIGWILKNDYGGQLTDDRIDLDALYYCQQKCDENEWSFDAVIDTSYSVLELVMQACAPYRVYPRLIGDKVSFVFDEANRPVKHVFTPRDITRGSLQPSWTIHTQLTPDTFIVSYLDEDVNYARREVDCTLPDSEALQPKYLQYPIGVCTRKLAHDYGIYIAACNRFRRIKLEFGTERIGRLLFRGDIVSVQHPRLRSLGFGRVLDWNEQQLRVDVDNSNCDFDPTTKMALWVCFNKPDGTVWGPVRIKKYFGGYLLFSQGDYDIVKSQQGNPFEWFSAGYTSQPTHFALQTGKQIDRRFIIEDIQYADLDHATITVMNDDPRVHSQVVPIPPWEYRNTNSTIDRLSPPLSLTIQSNEYNSIVKISWGSVVGAESYTLAYNTVVIADDGQITSEGPEHKIQNIVQTYIDIPYENFLLGEQYLFKVRAANSAFVSLYTAPVSAVVRPLPEVPEEPDEE